MPRITGKADPCGVALLRLGVRHKATSCGARDRTPIDAEYRVRFENAAGACQRRAAFEMVRLAVEFNSSQLDRLACFRRLLDRQQDPHVTLAFLARNEHISSFDDG